MTEVEDSARRGLNTFEKPSASQMVEPASPVSVEHQRAQSLGDKNKMKHIREHKRSKSMNLLGLDTSVDLENAIEEAKTPRDPPESTAKLARRNKKKVDHGRNKSMDFHGVNIDLKEETVLQDEKPITVKKITVEPKSSCCLLM